MCVHTHAVFWFLFLNLPFIALEDLPIISRRLFCWLRSPSPTAMAPRSFLLQYPEFFMFPSTALRLPSFLYYAAVVFALFPKIPFVTLEDLPFKTLFSLCDPLWSNRARELPTLPYRWPLFSLPGSFFSDTWNNQIVEKALLNEWFNLLVGKRLSRNQGGSIVVLNKNNIWVKSFIHNLNILLGASEALFMPKIMFDLILHPFY